MRKRYTRWQRLVMALRDIRDMATTEMSGMMCPGGCGPVVGDQRSWYCRKCNSSGSSG